MGVEDPRYVGKSQISSLIKSTNKNLWQVLPEEDYNCKDMGWITLADFTLVAIGHAPATELVKDVLETHNGGYIKVEPGSTKTSIFIWGIFAFYTLVILSLINLAMRMADQKSWHAGPGKD